MKLPIDELEELQYNLEGTMDSIEQHINIEKFDILEVEDQLLDQPHPVERCQACEWWFSSSDLTDYEDKFICDQCYNETIGE